MDETQIKKIFRGEIKDLTKTINRIYEDRDILLDLKTRVGAIEDLTRDLKDRVFKLERNVRGDLEDHQQKIEDMTTEVKDTLEVVLGGEEK